MNIYKKNFLTKNGIVQFNIEDSVTKKVIDFYKTNPFPNYDVDETKHSLLIKGNKNLLARELKRFVGFKKRVLEVGSGTSQLSMYLAIGTNNEIFALDPTIESLKLGKDFAKLNNIKNIHFINADIFNIGFEENLFDFVFCSGVLHHTKNPYEAFRILLKTLKKDGFIIVGLYNRIARIRTLLRRIIYKMLGKKIIMFLDPALRKMNKKSKDKINAWIRDQYEHPVESLHTFDEILSWFKNNNVEFINSIPGCELKFVSKNIFDKSAKGNIFSRLLSQIAMVFSSMGSEGGLFIFIGKKV